MKRFARFVPITRLQGIQKYFFWFLNFLFVFRLFVGGIDISQDRTFLQKGCRVAVGTSGRLAHLVKCRFLNPNKISLFVLDEADKLMEDSFKNEIKLDF